MISDDANDSPTAERVIDIQPRSARLNVHYHDPPADITPRPGSHFLLTPESLEVTQPFVYQPPVLPEPLIPPIVLDFDDDWDTESSASDVVANEVDFSPVIMAEERTLLPPPFSGAPESDASEFWRRLTTYITYKGSNEADRLRLAKAMFTESACDWLESLPDEQKDSFDSLRDAFKERYIQPAILRFRSARDIFGKKQSCDESVDAYASRLRDLSKKVQVDDNTLLYALLSGLKRKLASFVLARNPQTFVDAVDSARIAEYSIVDSGPDDQLTGQMAELRQDIQRLAQRYDSSPPPSAAIQNNTLPIPARRVTLRQPRGQANRGRVFTHPPGQGMRFQRPENQQPFAFRGQTAGRGRGNRFLFTPTDRFQSSVQQNTAQRCGKCGRAQHANVLYCPAVNKYCSFCGRMGHFRAVCRNARI